MGGRWTIRVEGSNVFVDGAWLPDLSTPVVPCDDAAVERAARGLCEYGVLTVDGEVATWERHHRKLTQMAQIALNCAAAPAREGTTNRRAM